MSAHFYISNSLTFTCTGNAPLTVKLKHENNVCQVNISNYKDLMKTVPILYNHFKHIDFAIQVNSAIVTDDSFNTYVETGTEVSIVSLSIPFSEYNNIEQLEEYAHITGVDEGLQLPPLYEIPKQSRIPIEVYNEIIARLEVFDLTESSKYIMREFISSILIGAVRLLGGGGTAGAVGIVGEAHSEGIKIQSEQYIQGSRGHGIIDYNLTFHSFPLLIVCEAKNGKTAVDAIPQLAAQLIASRQAYYRIQYKKEQNKGRDDVRGRKFEKEVVLEEVLDKLPSYGIISTGRTWVFVCYYKTTTTTTNTSTAVATTNTTATTNTSKNNDYNDTTTAAAAIGEGEWKLERSIELHLPLYTHTDERVGLYESIYRLLSIIAGILIVQRDAVLRYESTVCSFESSKRARTSDSI